VTACSTLDKARNASLEARHPRSGPDPGRAQRSHDLLPIPRAACYRRPGSGVLLALVRVNIDNGRSRVVRRVLILSSHKDSARVSKSLSSVRRFRYAVPPPLRARRSRLRGHPAARIESGERDSAGEGKGPTPIGSRLCRRTAHWRQTIRSVSTGRAFGRPSLQPAQSLPPGLQLHSPAMLRAKRFSNLAEIATTSAEAVGDLAEST
jgi:hypothetical protein